MQTIEINGVSITVLPSKPPKPLSLRPHEVEILQYMLANPTTQSQAVAATYGISPQQLNTLKRKLEAAKLLPPRVSAAQQKRDRIKAHQAWEAKSRAEHAARHTPTNSWVRIVPD